MKNLKLKDEILDLLLTHYDPEMGFNIATDKLAELFKKWALEMVGEIPFSVEDWEKFKKRIEEATE